MRFYLIIKHNLGISYKLLKKFVVYLSLPYTLSLIYFFSEEKLYNLVFKNSIISSRPTNNLNRRLVEFSYYYLPNILKKKIINSSMGNDIEGVEWAREYRGRGFPDSSYQFNLAYRYLEDYLDENKNRKVRLHQVCASSGREAHYFSNISRTVLFEASDISDAISEDIKKNYPNLECFAVDITILSKLKQVAKRCDLIIAFGGLQYLLPKELDTFFRTCCEEGCEIITSQPMHSELSPYKLLKSVPRGKMSWSHPYIYSAKIAGYEIKRVNTGFMSTSHEAQMVFAHFIPKSSYEKN